MFSKNTSYLSRLDHLRFFAALLVAAYHFHGGANIAVDTHNPLLMMIREGESGVSLFMVLSGFILTRIALGNKVDYKHFVFNRFLRIYPLYIVMVFVAAVSARQLDMLSFLAAVSSIGAIGGVTLGVFSHLWTIPVEFQFYLIFPFLVIFFARYGQRYLWGVIGVAIIFRIIMYFVNGTIQDGAYYSILGRIDQFAVGMLAAALYAKHPKLLSSPIALSLALGAVCAWFFAFLAWTGGYSGKGAATSMAWVVSPTIEAILWAGLSLAYLGQTWRMPQLLDKILAYLGVISFSLYACHSPIISAFAKNPSVLIFDAWYLDFLLIVMPAIVAVSSLTYFIIEKPFFAFRTRYVSAPSVASDRSRDAEHGREPAAIGPTKLGAINN